MSLSVCAAFSSEAFVAHLTRLGIASVKTTSTRGETITYGLSVFAPFAAVLQSKGPYGQPIFCADSNPFSVLPCPHFKTRRINAQKIRERERGRARVKEREFRKIAGHVEAKTGRERGRMQENKAQMANSHIVSRYSTHQEQNIAKARFGLVRPRTFSARNAESARQRRSLRSQQPDTARATNRG